MLQGTEKMYKEIMKFSKMRRTATIYCDIKNDTIYNPDSESEKYINHTRMIAQL